MDYLILSSGKKGDFKLFFESLDQALVASKSELASGQACELFVKHSDLIAGETKIIKSTAQLEAESMVKAEADLQAP